MSNAVTYTMWQERQDLCHFNKKPSEHLTIGGKQWCYSQESAIQEGAQWLIDRLYTPCSQEEHPWGRRAEDVDRLTKPFKVDAEPINWGDLNVVDVRGLGANGWLVEIEEADPNCPQFCAYIQHWLELWGWTDVVVRTEW